MALSSLAHAQVTPSVRTETVSVRVVGNGFRSTTADFALGNPVPLEGVSFVYLEAIQLDLERQSNTCLDSAGVGIALLSNGNEVAASGGGGINWCGTVGGTIGRGAIEGLPSTETVDAIRIVVTHTRQEGGNPVIRSTVTGIHENDSVRLHFIHGPFSLLDEGVHGVRILDEQVTQIQFSGSGSTGWDEYTFAEPVPVDQLRLTTHFGFGWQGNISATSESQFMLDDGSFLTLDDAFAPSMGTPRLGVNNSGHSLLLDATQRAANRDRTIVGWRWRIHKLGGGNITFLPFVPQPGDPLRGMAFVFFYDRTEPDCNENGTPDVEDLAGRTSDDCNGNNVPDECDRDCNSNGMPDDCELGEEMATDCNGNGIPDDCDVAAGSSADCNGNGVPDECDVAASDFALAGAVNHATGDDSGSVSAMGLGDLDGDGDLDAVVANQSLDHLTILENGGDGAFTASGQPATGETPRAIAIADVNGDGSLDVVVGHDVVSVHVNEGNGSLADPVELPVAHSVRELVAIDLDSDDDTDLIAGRVSSGDLSVLLNTGNGGFAEAVPYDVERSHLLRAVAFDREVVDLVVLLSTQELLILRNDGNGGFSEPEQIAMLPLRATDFELADLDGDDFLDIVASEAALGNVSVLLNDGENTFDNAVNYALGDYPLRVIVRDLEVADLDADGSPDLVASVVSAAPTAPIDLVSVVLNAGDGTFGPPVTTEIDSSPRDLAVGRLDGDALLDVGVLNTGSRALSVILNASTIASSRDCNDNGSPDACDIQDGVSSDANGNGIPDECDPPGQQFRRGDANADAFIDVSDASFILGFLFLGTEAPTCRRTADTNRDGALDVSDASRLLGHLFLGDPEPPPPYEECGVDEDSPLECESFAPCQ